MFFQKQPISEGHCVVCKKATRTKCDACTFYACAQHRYHAYDIQEKNFLGLSRPKEVWLCNDCFDKERREITNHRRKPLQEDIKDFVKRRFGNKCAHCGTSYSLVIHHKDENANNNDISNLICLCANCHDKMHRGTGKPVYKRPTNQEEPDEEQDDEEEDDGDDYQEEIHYR